MIIRVASKLIANESSMPFTMDTADDPPGQDSVCLKSSTVAANPESEEI